MNNILEHIQERTRLQSIIDTQPNTPDYRAALTQRAAIDRGLTIIGKLYLGIQAALARNENTTYEVVSDEQTATMVQEHFQQQGLSCKILYFESDEGKPIFPYVSIEVFW